MYERAYGSKCQPGVYRNTSDIAKDIRADIKAEVKAGNLPKATYSVKTRKYSGGSSIDVTVYDLPFDSHRPTEEWEKRHGWDIERMTEQAAEVEQAVKAIVWAYNYDGSESQFDYFDVAFYSHVNIASARESEWRQQKKQERAAKRKPAV